MREAAPCPAGMADIEPSSGSPGRGTVHLVGSVPLATAEAVFDMVGSRLGTRCARIPDGETGPRGNWIAWQRDAFAVQTALRRTEARERDYQLHPPFVFAAGAGAADLEFGSLGFAEAALRSWRLFAERQAAGVLPEAARFLVAFPTPFAPVYSFAAYEIQEAVYPVYAAALLSELGRICEEVPHDRLAVQWDVATEMSILEEVYPAPFENPRAVLIDRLAGLGRCVPAAVDLGYHLCYGSMNDRHWKEPEDLALCVAVADAIESRLDRPIRFLHMPVPVDRADDAYYAPLGGLRLGGGTELFLGLVHDCGGIEGNRARIAAAAKYHRSFGIAAECGFGRRPPEAVPRLLALHAALADGLGAPRR